MNSIVGAVLERRVVCSSRAEGAVRKRNIMTWVKRIESLVVVVLALGCMSSARAQSPPNDLLPVSPSDLGWAAESSFLPVMEGGCAKNLEAQTLQARHDRVAGVW